MPRLSLIKRAQLVKIWLSNNLSEKHDSYKKLCILGKQININISKLGARNLISK